tara:strand:+ start:373 stop:630 length:258 start_codon:yes stop_codon:yes gene_type:complete
MLEIRLFGNDLEVGGEKVARVFDIRPSLLQELELAIDRANVSEEEIKSRIDEAYDKGYDEGKEHGYEEGRQTAHDERTLEEKTPD